MFSSKRKPENVNTGMISTIIGDNSKVEGLLEASDPTRVDGLLQGRILSKSSVIVGENGVVRGDINAVEILVAGTVYGNLNAEQRIELTETGRVLGDLVTKVLVIDEGASFKGSCTMEIMEEKKAGESTGMDSESHAEPVKEESSDKKDEEEPKKK